jgi:peptidyl-Lys metalloendopeptidase
LVIATCALADIIPTISIERDNVHLGLDKIRLNWKIENTDSSPALLLKFGTPLEGTFQNTLTTNMFSIVHVESGVSPVYTGILMKRDATPKAENYIVLQGNSELSGQIILCDAYHFPEDGVYTIQLATTRSNMLTTFPFTSNQIQITISGSKPFVYKESVNLAVTFKSCTTSEQSIVNTAISAAITASANALSYLNSGCRPTYTTWFGTYSSSNYATVDSHFTNINSALAGKDFGIDCGCNQAGTYAYVYPTDPSKTIYLCPVFWDASTNAYAYNSQPGTLTHEMSHFNAVAGTEDYQYGVTGCKNLAETNPSRAINNADNHEYFQESKPQC